VNKNLNKILISIVFGCSLFVGLILINGDTPEKFERPQVKYTEEPYTLKDGTPCTVLIDPRSLGGIVAITCNYNKEKL
jgi:hypothetical protein